MRNHSCWVLALGNTPNTRPKMPTRSSADPKRSLGYARVEFHVFIMPVFFFINILLHCSITNEFKIEESDFGIDIIYKYVAIDHRHNISTLCPEQRYLYSSLQCRCITHTHTHTHTHIYIYIYIYIQVPL